MNRKELSHWTAYYSNKVDQANANLKLIRAQYIEANAKHPIGSTVTVLEAAEKFVLRVKDYKIEEGELIPKFETLEGKNKFLSDRYVILD